MSLPLERSRPVYPSIGVQVLFALSILLAAAGAIAGLYCFAKGFGL